MHELVVVYRGLVAISWSIVFIGEGFYMQVVVFLHGERITTASRVVVSCLISSAFLARSCRVLLGIGVFECTE